LEAELAEAESKDTARLEAERHAAQQAEAALKAAEATLAASGDITEEEIAALKEEAKAIAQGVVPDAVDSGAGMSKLCLYAY
jgi:hypothetical protein